MNYQIKKRPYRSRLRQKAAKATRQTILNAARRLFASQGYAATTLSAIADKADVSVATITSRFGTKLALLEAVVKWDVRGDELPVPLRDRSWWQMMLLEEDPRKRIERYAANVRQIHERTTDLFEIVRSAAPVEPAIAALQQELGKSHYQDDYKMAESFSQQSALSPNVSLKQAADLLWTLGSADLYRLFVVSRGWAPGDYEKWLAASWIRMLLEENFQVHGEFEVEV